MATQVIHHVSCTRICCGGLPSDVIVCVPDVLVVPKLCPPPDEDAEPEEQPFSYSYIEGQITAETQISRNCITCWRYTIEYDDTQLIEGTDPSTVLVNGVFCKDCFTQWVEDKVGNEPYISIDSGGTQTFVSPHGCEYPLNSLGNCVDSEDTDSINMTVTTDDTGCHIVSADAILSAEEGNQLSLLGDGLYGATGYRRLANDISEVENTLPSPSTLASYTLPGNTLSQEGDTLLITVAVTLALNGNAKTTLLGIDGPDSFTLGLDFNNTTPGGLVSFEFKFCYRSPGNITYRGQLFRNDGTFQNFGQGGSGTFDATLDHDIVVLGGSTLAGDITQSIFIVDLVKGV